MPNQKHFKLIKRGVNAWNKWRRERERGGIGPNLVGADLCCAKLRGANLFQTFLTGADLIRADLRKANLSGASLRRAHLIQTDLSDANLVKAGLVEARLWDAKLDGANLSGADLRETDLRGANLVEANLVEADLRGANLGRVSFKRANLGGANLAGAGLFKANLIKANLMGADLSGARFIRAKLNGANLIGAKLHGTNLSDASLIGAKLGGADLFKADLGGAKLRRADLSAANLTGASLVETNLENANLNGCRIYGISAWNIKVNQETKQSDLIITQSEEATVKVDDIQVAQFIHLILKYENLRNVLNSVTKRGVLILGRFGGGGLEILRALGEALRQSGYLPMIFEFERLEDRNYTETVRTLAGLARFVVVDLSGPSVPQELYATVPHLQIPFVPILEKGKQPYSMFRDLLIYEWMLNPIVEFDSTTGLIQDLPDKIVGPAEKRIETRQAKLKELFG